MLTKIYSRTSVVLLASSALMYCGEKEKESTAAPVVYGNMTVLESKGGDASTVEFNGVTTCTRNADTGRVDVTLTNGTGKPSMSIAIKNYSSTPQKYTCTQAADNSTSDASVGGKFDNCMTSIMVLPSSASALNGYNMYRETSSTKKFSYSGACTIDVTTASPSIIATIECQGLVQTILEGAARNPIESSVTANLKGDVNCRFTN